MVLNNLIQAKKNFEWIILVKEKYDLYAFSWAAWKLEEIGEIRN